jgi:hypothetical protein
MESFGSNRGAYAFQIATGQNDSSYGKGMYAGSIFDLLCTHSKLKTKTKRMTIFLVDPSTPELFQPDLFPPLQGDFYVLIQGAPSVAHVALVKGMFPDLTRGNLKVVFVKDFSRAIIEKFASKVIEHPSNIVDLRPTELMRHTHLVPPHVSRAIIRATPFNSYERELVPKMILDTITFLVQGLTIQGDYVILKAIQKKFEEHLTIELDPVGEFDPRKHSKWSKPEEHIQARIDPDGGFAWPVNSKRVQTILSALDRIDFEELVDLANHDEINMDIQENSIPEEDPGMDHGILPVGVRKFISDRANTNQRFRTGMIQTCPEAEFAKALTGSLEHTNGAIDLFIEPRTDIQTQISVLQEVFPTLTSGGMMYFINPAMELTVMLSTWSTTVPLGSLHGHLDAAFEQFGRFCVFPNNAVGIVRKEDDRV